MASSFDTANHGYKVLLGTSNKPKKKGVPNMAGQRKFPTPGGNGKLSDLVHRSTDPKPSLSSGPYVPGQGGGLIQLDAMPQQQPIGQGQPYQMTVSPVVGGQPVGGRLEVDPNNPWAGGPPQRRLDPLVGAPAYDSVTEQINRIREEAAMSRSGIPQAPAAPQMPAYGTVSEQAPPPPPPPQMPGQMPPVSSQATQMPHGGMSQGPPVMGKQPTFPPVPQAAPQPQPQQSRPWQQPATAESLDQTLRSLYEGGLAPQDKQQIEDWATKAWDDENTDSSLRMKLTDVLDGLGYFSRPRQGQNEGQAQPQQQPAQPATPQQAPPTVAQQVGAAAAPQPQQPQQAMPPQEQLPAEAGRLAEMLGGPSRTEANPYRPADISSLSEADRKDIIDRMTRQSGPDPGGPMGAEALTRGGLAGVQGDLSGHLQDGNWNAANAALKQQSSDRNAAARDKRAAMTQGLRGDMYEGSLIPGTQYEHVNMNMPGRPNRWVTRGGNVSGASRPGTAGDAGQQYHGTGMLGDSRAPFNPMTSEQEDRESTMMEILNQNRSGGRDAQNAALVQAGFPELRGLSVESPGLRENERFQASRQNRKGEMYLRRALITDREELKGDQRRARIAERKRVPTRGEIAMQRAFNRNPRLAMDMMRMRQRGNLGQQQLGLQEFIAANRESGAQRRHEEIMEAKQGARMGTPIENLGARQAMRESIVAELPEGTPSDQVDRVLNERMAAAGFEGTETGQLGRQLGGGSTTGTYRPPPTWTIGLNETDMLARAEREGWPDESINGLLATLYPETSMGRNVMNPKGISGWRAADHMLGEFVGGVGELARLRKPRRWGTGMQNALRYNQPDYTRQGTGRRVTTKEQAYWARKGMR